MTQDKVQAQTAPPRDARTGSRQMIESAAVRDRNIRYRNVGTRERETGIRQMKSGLVLTGATSAALLIMGHSAQAAWDFVTLQDPGAVSTTASGINDFGQVVGSYVD